MDPASGPSEARRALAEIQRRQNAVIDRVLVPGWFWWLVGIGAIGVGAAADSADAATIAIAAVVFAVVVVAAAGSMIIGAYSGARIRSELLGSDGALAIVGFVGVTLGVTLALGFGWRAVGFGYPGTVSTAVCAVLLILGGPRLMARLRRVMMDNRDLGR